MAVTGHHARLGTRLLAKLYRGRHFRRLGYMRFQGATRPDPIVQDLETLEVAEHQPYIHRVTRLGALAQTQGRSLQFVHAIAPVLWDGTVNRWNEGDHLARAAAAAGFDLAAMDKAIEADPDRLEAVIAGNENDHAASGHWGVPTFVFETETFFGQDRIDLLIWRMESQGLTSRK
jgi:2-hydroxychromene-2-carboxylate isomerase